MRGSWQPRRELRAKGKEIDDECKPKFGLVIEPDDKGGFVQTAYGYIPFDQWYQEKYNEEPSRANIRKRLGTVV